MKKILSILFGILIYASTSLLCSANGGHISSTSSGSLKLLDDNQIQMVTELININIYPNKKIKITDENEDRLKDPKFFGYGEFNIKYIFKNTTGKSVKVKMGFPEKCLGLCSDETGNLLNADKLHDFKTLDSGEIISTAFTLSPNKEDIYNWYVFEVDFKPNEQKEIENSYWATAKEQESLKIIDYIIETGASWKNKIEKLDIYVHFKGDLSIFDLYNSPDADFTISPGGYTLDPAKEKTLEWHLQNFEPTPKDNINIPYRDYTYPDPLVFTICTEEEPTASESSSYLPKENETYYYPCFAEDGDETTAWIEGAKNSGMGEWLKIVPEGTTRTYYKLKIFNGYGYDKNVWKQNNRIKKARLSFGNEERMIELQNIDLQDTFSYQTIDLKNPLKITDAEAQSKFFKLEILDVYKGAKYDDTAISEIRFLGLIDSAATKTPEDNKPVTSELVPVPAPTPKAITDSLPPKDQSDDSNTAKYILTALLGIAVAVILIKKYS